MVGRNSYGLTDGTDASRSLTRCARMFEGSARIGLEHLRRGDEVASDRFGVELGQAPQLTPNRRIEQPRVGAIGDPGFDNAISQWLDLGPTGCTRPTGTRAVRPPAFWTASVGSGVVRAAATGGWAGGATMFRATMFWATSLTTGTLRTTAIGTDPSRTTPLGAATIRSSGRSARSTRIVVAALRRSAIAGPAARWAAGP